MDNISCISSLQAVVENLLVQTFSEEQRSGHETETSSHASERMQLPIQSIDRISSAISLDDFFQKYLLKNIPCIISKWITKDWTSCKQWSVLHNGRSLPNFQEFLGLGSSVVSVADCRKREFNSQPKEDWLLKDYLAYLENYINSGYPKEQRCLYLKDWHLTRDHPDLKVYSVPTYFSDDWLLELYSHGQPPFDDDFRFVYIGPKQSWTPFHADVFRSYSWSANVCGKKKWLLYPPGYEDQLRNEAGKLPYDIRVLEHCSSEKKCPISIIQEAGEIVFVPSGWYHEVINLMELTEVEKEISDCRSTMTKNEWSSQCQLIMKVNSGINYEDFFSLLNNILATRKNILEAWLPKITKIGPVQSDFQFVFKLSKNSIQRLNNVLCHNKSKQNPVFKLDHFPIIGALVDCCLILPVLLDILSKSELGCLELRKFSVAEIVLEICNDLYSFVSWFNDLINIDK
ncbi:2-oxoglutarate and iron-dependent oxygenase JMJD4-like isoform X2 [Clavelina lepadiformis]|uniref:2-oxoglutarate and iron-dependent oxygenase JMJD4-like isoform X2 n=1 Tax=Clavelina lepadiformis TaxID=159417 RepID=UPI004042F245